ncbi:hypothetical protein FEM48_Zijuj07G0086300 [Ziziphus jujuba var. spinosa]|uniref:EF-hand domain-containing protein n=1 Tax=Ziziphus jujuba var. spinosa TaxID=714518 RepID=A0A978V3L6_ZIZJJ|nr:hypothetical protein FEM48_Zijuj07G0086300 [Ziziphus jujuba var. spinosa]
MTMIKMVLSNSKISKISRQFGYNDDLQLPDFVISPSTVGLAPDHETCAELSDEAIKFLRGIFNWFDLDSNGALTLNEMSELFDMAPRSPFFESPYKHASLMPLLDATFSMKNLSYIGYGGEPTSAICVTRKINDVDWSPGAKKFLVLREFPEDTIGKRLLSGGKALVSCDVAVFVYDTSDVSLKNGSTNLLNKVAQHSSRDTLLPIKTKLGNSNEVFYEIAKAGGYMNTAWKSAFCSFRVDSSDDLRVGLQEIV